MIEVHPEVSFRAMFGAPIPYSKKTWNGQMQRRQLLANVGLELPEQIEGDGGTVPVDDILDAAAAAWTARRWTNGEAESLPEGLAGRIGNTIWY